MDPLTVLTAFIPVISQTVGRLLDRFTGSPVPQTVQQAIELNNSEVERLKALAALDSSENTSRWVSNIRAMQRPVAVAIILFVWAVIALVNQVDITLIENLASSAVFYLFGDRTMMYINRTSNQKPVKKSK